LQFEIFNVTVGKLRVEARLLDSSASSIRARAEGLCIHPTYNCGPPAVFTVHEKGRVSVEYAAHPNQPWIK